MSKFASAVYNTIGKTYDATRSPDPEIVKIIFSLLQPQQNGHYLDVACGSGNYTNALAKSEINIEGVDISEEMLGKARKKNPDITWHQGDAKALPFENSLFDGAICTLATHHMGHFEDAFREVYRVINKGNFVVFTCTPRQIEDCWLQEYFPKMIDDAKNSFANFERLENAFNDAGFKNIRQKPFFVTETLTDLFLYAGKQRPEMYLDPAVRAGISSFHLSVYGDEVEKGLIRLEADISSGKIEQIMSSYESKNGDYLFVAGEKI
jgi:SAM-dependent methyltransferase